MLDKVLARNPRALGRFLRLVDDRDPVALGQLGRLHVMGGGAVTIGITGIPGAGKSTLTGEIVRHLRRLGSTVAVVAIDPSSPFTGGAILGDRIRMRALTGDDGVFIRSLATRGALGGLTRSARDHLTVLDAAGFDHIIVETVGVGQDEVDISQLTQTNCVVCVPGTGDGVQALKAGLLEVADIFVVNKADRDGADRLVRELELLLQLEGSERGGWTVPILKTTATTGDGLEELVTAIAGHNTHLQGPEGDARARLRARAALVHRVHDEIWGRIQERLSDAGGLDSYLERIVSREQHPSEFMEDILGSFFN